MKLHKLLVCTCSWSIDLEVLVKVVSQYQVMRHAQAVRLHRVVWPIVVSPNLLVVVIADPIFRDHAATTRQLCSVCT